MTLSLAGAVIYVGGGEVSVLQEREMFASGFCLTVRIMAEVMGTIEFPSVDD